MASEMILGVNIDHVATIRQARFTHYPDPVHAAYIAEMAGAQVITFHLREDRRHIQERDVRLLKDTVACRTNLEMAITPEMVDIAIDVGPDDCCLVPDRNSPRKVDWMLQAIRMRCQLPYPDCRMQASGFPCLSIPIWIKSMLQ